MSDDLVKRLQNPPFGTETSERNLMAKAAAALVAKDAEIARLREAVDELNEWALAYPVAVFPEPDFRNAHKALQTVGITIDAVSASNFRHVLKRVKEITAAALNTQHKGETP